MKNRWLDRHIAAPGPFLTLCLSENEFQQAMRILGIKRHNGWINPSADATTHIYTNKESRLCCIVCLNDFAGRDPIKVAGLLVHEAVHVWQAYAERIGEDLPGIEQEAYAVQAISQELMAEFARRMAV